MSVTPDSAQRGARRLLRFVASAATMALATLAWVSV